MSLSEELAGMDATAQAALVRERQVTPIDLVEAGIARAERVNPELNAIVTPLYEEARRAAAGDLPEGPFTGVPFLVKDIIASYAGAPMTSGSMFMKDYVPAFDSELVTRQKKAGLVTIGKTNLPEFGILPTTEPRFFGPCRNPWDTSRSTGGSSGGSAAAVSAGVVPMAHANDAGGSIRIPASCCGVFGLKPTRARNSLAPVGDLMSGLVAEHAVTRSVRDSAALLDATRGPVPGDPYWAPPPARPFIEEVGADPGTLRVGLVLEDPTGGQVGLDCVRAVKDVAGLLEGLGHQVVGELTVDFDVQTVVQSFTAVYSAGNAWAVDSGAALTGKTPASEEFEPLTWALFEMGHRLDAPGYITAVTALQAISARVQEIFLDYDVVLMPTITEPPFPLGSFEGPPGNPLFGLIRAAGIVPFTTIGNFSGLPAMSVPLYWNAEGLPVGTMFYGRFGDEATLFRLAAQLEQARPWAGRKPPVSA